MRKYKTIDVSEYDKMLEELSISKSIDLNNFDLLIYGGGGQDRKYYLELKFNSKCEVLWTGWPGPKWSSIFSFIPGQAGLVKINDQSAFKEIFYDLAAFSVSDVIYVPKIFTPLVLEEASSKTWRARFEKFIELAPSSFVMTSEADETIEKNGREMYFYDYHLGADLNQTLIRIIERKETNYNEKN